MDSDEEMSSPAKKGVRRVLFPGAARQNQDKVGEEDMDKAPEETSSPDAQPFVLQSPEVQASIVRTFGPEAFATPSRGQADGVPAQSARARAAPQTAPAASWRTVPHRRLPRGSGPHGPFKPVIVEAKDNPAYNMIASSALIEMDPRFPEDTHSAADRKRKGVKWADDEEEESPVPSAAPRPIGSRLPPEAAGTSADKGSDNVDMSKFVWLDPDSPTPSIPHVRKEIECLNTKTNPPAGLQRPAERPHGPRPMPTSTAEYTGGGGFKNTTDRHGVVGSIGSPDKSMMGSDVICTVPTPHFGSGGKRSRDELENDATAVAGQDSARGTEATRRKTVHAADEGKPDSDDSDPTPKASGLDMKDGSSPEKGEEMDVDEKQHSQESWGQYWTGTRMTQLSDLFARAIWEENRFVLSNPNPLAEPDEKLIRCKVRKDMMVFRSPERLPSTFVRMACYGPDSVKAPKKNNIAAKKAAPAKKGIIKTGRVTKTAKKNTYKAAKDTANTAADTTTTAATNTATTPEGAEGLASTAIGAKERYSAKNPPPDFIGVKFDTPYKGCVKA
ncbi:hypothetical protein ACRALDRAFT_1068970 [Sodiomyces alcalophilus JCM 7366]|uniref:uncharacterized protein n=1 Tax=Sodiomyces alcalophilus JCM 7366 TaxID=591952 RepID=UPI0039B404D8